MTVSQTHVVEFGAYVENGVLVAGWRLAGGAVSEIILQDDPTRLLTSPGLEGPYLAIDGSEAYRAVLGFAYDPSEPAACLLLDHRATPLKRLDLPVPASAKPEERLVLRQLAASISTFLRA